MSVTLDLLFKKYDRKILIPIEDACAEIGWTMTYFYGRKNNNVEFPIKLRRPCGRKLFVHVADLADHIDGSGGTPSPATAAPTTLDGRPKDPKKGGRPRKAEVEAKRLALMARSHQDE